MSREYCQDCGDHTQNGVCEVCDLAANIQPCGECGSQSNPIVTQCQVCGCAICAECEDHEAKC